MKHDFYKYEALGNDYIVIDPQQISLELTPQRIQKICDRHFGVGSDGILYGPLFQDEKIQVRIFNPDGSEAEKSGNGIRIFSRFLWDQGYVQEKHFSLTTLGGDVAVTILDELGENICVDMGTATFDSAAIPAAGARREMLEQSICVHGKRFQVTCLSIGNPHCVIFDPAFTTETVNTWGPLLEQHDDFLERTNVQFVRVLDRHNLEIEIWERGAGYTLASGSSSAAVAKAAFALGMVERNLTVHMPGGTLAVTVQQDGHIVITGPVHAIATGSFCFSEMM
ncbi:MAG: diaminopimelate epimerase [Sporomusaceae bacterium]|nr:diaminopimelate epimerase [Sporomusaceae bacterium]